MQHALAFITLLACSIMQTAFAAEQGPEPLAVSFMTQFYDVEADAVKVKVTPHGKFEALVEAEAAGHFCEFEAVQLPAGTSAKHGWAAASMRCGE